MEKIVPYLKNVTAISGYQLIVEFEDGVSGFINLGKWKGKGIFKYRDDETNFQKFKITADKKIELNEDIDTDPDAFYLQLNGKPFQEYALDKQLLRHCY